MITATQLTRLENSAETVISIADLRLQRIAEKLDVRHPLQRRVQAANDIRMIFGIVFGQNAESLEHRTNSLRGSELAKVEFLHGVKFEQGPLAEESARTVARLEVFSQDDSRKRHDREFSRGAYYHLPGNYLNKLGHIHNFVTFDPNGQNETITAGPASNFQRWLVGRAATSIVEINSYVDEPFVYQPLTSSN